MNVIASVVATPVAVAVVVEHAPEAIAVVDNAVEPDAIFPSILAGSAGPLVTLPFASKTAALPEVPVPSLCWPLVPLP